MEYTATYLPSYNALSGKHVVVVGGLGLLGRSFSRGIAAAGATVTVADLVSDEGTRFTVSLNDELGESRIHFQQLDLTSPLQIKDAIHACHTKHGRIDAVVNCAYPRGPNYGRKFEEVEYADFCATLNAHLGGYFLIAQQFALFFREHGGGHVISVSSIYGIIAPRFEIYEDTALTMPIEYAAVKSALIHITRYMAKYFRGTSVRFNCISPGGIYDHQPVQFVEKYNANGTSKGMLSQQDLVGAVVFLLSDASLYINGQNIVIDDGWTL